MRYAEKLSLGQGMSLIPCVVKGTPFPSVHLGTEVRQPGEAAPRLSRAPLIGFYDDCVFKTVSHPVASNESLLARLSGNLANSFNNQGKMLRKSWCS